MINNMKELQVKNRHDIFDTVVLYKKEKKVFYFLLLILIFVIGYEFSDVALNWINPSPEVIAPVRVRIKVLNTAKLDKLKQMVNNYSSELPQFRPSFNAIVNDISNIQEKVKTSIKHSEILKLQQKMVSKLWNSLNSPYLDINPELTSLQKYVKRLLKRLKLTSNYVIKISPILFNKKIADNLVNTDRNLFKFSTSPDNEGVSASDSEAYWKNVVDYNKAGAN